MSEKGIVKDFIDPPSSEDHLGNLKISFSLSFGDFFSPD